MALVPRYQTRRYLERGYKDTSDVEVGVANIVTLDIRDSTKSDVGDADQKTATEGTYTLFSGSVILVDTVAVTTVGPPASYTIPAGTLPSTIALSSKLQERWDLTIDGRVERFVVPASLCRFIPRPVITDTDLINLHTDLRRLVDTDEDDFGRQRDEAWVWVVKQLEYRGRRPELVLDSTDLRDAHIARSLFVLFRDYANSTTTDQRYAKLAEDYEERAQKALDTVPMDYDSDEDGFDDSSSTVASTPTLSINRPPRWG